MTRGPPSEGEDGGPRYVIGGRDAAPARDGDGAARRPDGVMTATATEARYAGAAAVTRRRAGPVPAAGPPPGAGLGARPGRDPVGGSSAGTGQARGRCPAPGWARTAGPGPDR